MDPYGGGVGRGHARPSGQFSLRITPSAQVHEAAGIGQREPTEAGIKPGLPSSRFALDVGLDEGLGSALSRPWVELPGQSTQPLL